MRNTLGKLLAAVLLALCVGPPLALAQPADDLHPNAHGGIFQPAATPPPTAATTTGDKPEKPAPTLAYLAAVASAVIVMCIICVPSRKSESMTSR